VRIAVEHVKLPVAVIDRTRDFYTRALAPLGYDVVYDHNRELGFGNKGREPLGFTEREAPAVGTHVAFTAEDQASVDAFHAAAVAAGGRDNGAPGPRPYGGEYYAAFVLDPDGHNIEAVHHGERAE
jgi:catechol 2,3-dioxygenase-like lactoylglutathione lyase family enzyme